MNNKSPIPVPWKVRWRHWRHGMLPILCFIVSALLVGWLWQHQLATRQVVGEVMAIRVEVGGPCSGVIVDLPRQASGQWSPLDSVKQGDTLALVRPTLFPGATPPGAADQDASPIPVHAPINGCVLHIYRRIGQSVQAFEPIMTISGEEAKYILAYVPEHMLGETKEGSSVKVASSRMQQRGYVACTVERVGLSLEEVPQHHLPNPTVTQWGVPVRIRLPEGIPLRPGSLVNITLTPGGGERGAGSTGQGARGREHGAGSTGLGARGWEHGAGSTGLGAHGARARSEDSASLGFGHLRSSAYDENY